MRNKLEKDCSVRGLARWWASAFLFLLLAMGLPAPAQEAPSQLGDEEGEELIIIKAPRGKQHLPLFFAAREEARLRISPRAVRQEIQLSLTILQGAPAGLSLALYGEGVIRKVEGAELASWAVKKGVGENGEDLSHLVLYPTVAGEVAQAPRTFAVTVTAETEISEGTQTVEPLTLGPGEAAGFSGLLELIPAETVDVEVSSHPGLFPLGEAADARQWRFQTNGVHGLALTVRPRGAGLLPIELSQVQLRGQLAEDGRSVSFRMTAEATVHLDGGGVLPLLSGDAALSRLPEIDGAGLRVAGSGNYELVFEAAGVYPLDVAFEAKVTTAGDTNRFSFRVPGSALASMTLRGFPQDVRFDPRRAVYPTPSNGEWLGFLPAGGVCEVAWKDEGEIEAAKLFFATEAGIDVRVGAGLLRQETHLKVNVLQGRLEKLVAILEGPGEIVAVDGSGVLAPAIEPREDGSRALTIEFSQPLQGAHTFVIRSQTALGEFPIRTRTLRVTPEGAVRHAGHIRLSNEGAIRLEVVDPSGITQLAPNQFPGDLPQIEDGRQVLVYRFPSSTYDFEIVAEQILPEVGVSQVVVYEMTDADRVISAAIELDIREAPLRDWPVAVPEDYSVVAVTGAAVADYALEETVTDGRRSMKVIFNEAVQGRQLVQLRLEKNETAQPGVWNLPRLDFPQAKSFRGHLGVSATAGYRITPGAVNQLSEVPLSFFPLQVPRLQQAFRLRDADWSASMNVEALGQTVQADVFHLYSLKEGMAYGSILVNYFVGGSPVSEWRLQAPADAGKVAIEGQHVQGWRQEGNEVIVTLHQPVLGPATVLLTFQQPMNARGGVLSPGQVRPLDVQGERGYIQVVSPFQVQSEVTEASPSLLSVEPLELPAEYRLFTSSPTVAAYQYTSRPFALDLGIQWFEPADLIEQVVDYAVLESQVSQDGQVVTDARFFVKSRGRQALRLKIPFGAKLWEIRVDGAAVNARQDGDLTLVPLAATLDPNEKVEVRVRIGQSNQSARHPRVAAPVVLANTMMAEWHVRGERGQLLLPEGDSEPLLAKPVVTETGGEWLYHRAWRSPVLPYLGFFLVLGLALAFAPRSRWTLVLGALALALAVLGCLLMAGEAADDAHRRVNAQTLEFVAQAVAPGQALVLTLSNVPAWQAMIVWWGAAAVLLGTGILVASWFLRKAAGCGAGCVCAGWILVAVGLLVQHFGAVAFFIWVGLTLVAMIFYQTWTGWRRLPKRERKSKETPSPDEGDSALGAATSLVMAGLCGLLVFGSGQSVRAQDDQVDSQQAATPAPAEIEEKTMAADTLVETWSIRKNRLYGEFELHVTGKKNESLLLLRDPAVLTGFESPTSRVAKRPTGERTDYWLVLDEDGEHMVRATFELALFDLQRGFQAPTGVAAVHEVTLTLDQPGWEISSPAAVRTEPLSDQQDGGSGVRLLLGPQTSAPIHLQPRSRDVASEAARFFAEVVNLYVPNPGVVDGKHRVTIRPAQGQVETLNLLIPEMFTVSDLTEGPVKGWRFDPESRRLQVDLEPAQSQEFRLTFLSQRAVDDLPVDVLLAPAQVLGAAGEVGTVGVAFGSDAQASSFTETGMSAINLSDFDRSLLGGEDGHGEVELQRVYRYGQEGGVLTVRVTPVEADIRVQTKQTLSLGQERLVLAVDLVADITRSGIFKLSFPLPDGLEVEAISGENLSHWTELAENGQRVITMHLAEKALGQQSFAVSLAGQAPGPQEEWSVPRFSIREARRGKGQLLVASELGIRAQVVSRDQVSPVDPRQLTGQRPGTLAFLLLQDNWQLTLRLEALDPWLTAQVLEEVTLREGVTRTRLAILYQIENAAVKELRVTLPPLNADEEKTVRATGEAVSDMVPVAGEPNVWEIQFKNGQLGSTAVEVRYQRTGDRASGFETFMVTKFANVRQLTHWFAVRAAGRLEVEASDPPAGWQRADWTSVPEELHDAQDRSVPALCLRASDPEAALQIAVRRNEVAEALKLRVAAAELTTAFSPEGDVITHVRLQIDVMENSAIRFTLPQGARLFNAFVNGESVAVVRARPTSRADGDEEAYLVTVTPVEEASRSTVAFAYAVPAGDGGPDTSLTGPELSVPLQNITWNVILPTGYRLDDFEGDLELTEEQQDIRFRLQDYLAVDNRRVEQEDRDSRDLVKQAAEWIREGEQMRARKALQRASGKGDPSTNEDARVQLRQLQTEQAVVGLNTLRQKLYLDNRGDAAGFERGEALQRAAEQNQLLSGELDYQPSQVDVILQGNTQEENEALKRIANRIVNQQSAAGPALQAIDATLPIRGDVARFSRSVQVNGDQALQLHLELTRERAVPVWFIVVLLAAMGALFYGSVWRIERAGVDR